MPINSSGSVATNKTVIKRQFDNLKVANVEPEPMGLFHEDAEVRSSESRLHTKTSRESLSTHIEEQPLSSFIDNVGQKSASLISWRVSGTS